MSVWRLCPVSVIRKADYALSAQSARLTKLELRSLKSAPGNDANKKPWRNQKRTQIREMIGSWRMLGTPADRADDEGNDAEDEDEASV